MSSTINRPSDLEQGFESGRIVRPSGDGEDIELGSGTTNRLGNDGPGPVPEGLHEMRNDFDDGANALWSLYGKEAKGYDEAWVQKLKDDMDGVLLYAGLLSGVITAFVVPQIQDLQVNPAKQSVYYQQQSVRMLAQISQQIASISSQAPAIPPPSPDPTFHTSGSDRRVNIFWLLSLIFSLSATLLSTLVLQWVRVYMRVYQPSNNTPLKTARMRQFLFEGVERLPVLAEATGGLIQLSLLLFFLGLGDSVLNIDAVVGFAIIIPIVLCAFLYLYGTIAPIINPQSPYRNPLSSFVWYLNRNLLHVSYRCFSLGTMIWPTSMEAQREQLAMKECKDRDVHAVRWLIGNLNGITEMETFVLAIPGSFDQDWGRNVWKEVSVEGVSTEAQPLDVQAHDPPREGTAAHNLCRCVRYLFETYHNEGDAINKEALRRRMHGCVETAVSLVCCTSIQPSWFGEVGGILSELAHNERTNESLTISSNPSFTVHWTCLSLVAIRQTVDDQKLQELARFAVSGIARFQAEYGDPDARALKGAKRIEGRLRMAWEHVEDLHRAFRPWNPNRTDEEIIEILSGREVVIGELEHMEVDADTMKDVDWRISLLQDAMDEATHKLTLRLSSVLLKEPKRAGPHLISEAFDIPLIETTPVTSQLISPGKQIQGLCTLSGRLRDIIEERNPRRHKEALETLESIDRIPILLRQLNYQMKRQLWRLQDLRDGGGLGFTIELFFLALRRLMSTSLMPESKSFLYSGTFDAITSRWMKSKDSIGTQRILLDLICDLVIQGHGVFSNFSYPEDVVDKLLKLVRKMTEGHNNPPHISEVAQELLNVDPRNRRDPVLRGKALGAIRHAE
ncbi:hypothetical protein BC826DRAFT_972851 [Russula brevipes]|nr:hypothetical protein BC826DRAFT_972851 [Russula brevipes]